MRRFIIIVVTAGLGLLFMAGVWREIGEQGVAGALRDNLVWLIFIGAIHALDAAVPWLVDRMFPPPR